MPSRKSNISFHPEYQSNGDLLANWSSTRHISQKTGTMDGSFYFFRVLFQPHTKKERHRKLLDRTNHRISKVTLGPLLRLHALEILNLSNNAIHALSVHGSCSHSQLPQVKVLILQRNQLRGTPEGEHWRGSSDRERAGWELVFCVNESSVCMFSFKGEAEKAKQ